MDYRSESVWQEPRLTLGELCEAIAEGRIGFRQHHGYVELTVRDVRRLAREDHVLGARPLPAVGAPGDGIFPSGSFA